jgi:hypothetical protein
MERWRIGKDLEGANVGLIEGIIPAFAPGLLMIMTQKLRYDNWRRGWCSNQVLVKCEAGTISLCLAAWFKEVEVPFVIFRITSLSKPLHMVFSMCLCLSVRSHISAMASLHNRQIRIDALLTQIVSHTSWMDALNVDGGQRSGTYEYVHATGKVEVLQVAVL